MQKEGKVILAFIGSLWIAMPLYLFLHEGGHALIAILCGAKIVDFNLMQGYVIAEGGTFNDMTLALFNIAGVLIPAATLLIYLILYKRNTRGLFYQLFSVLFTGIIIFSMGVWIVVPILYMLGRANPIDDVVKFIEVLNIHPIFVTLGASIVTSLYIMYVWKKGVLQNCYKAVH